MRVPAMMLSALLSAAAGAAFGQTAFASQETVVYLSASGFSSPSSAIAVGDRVRFTVRDRKPHQIAKTSSPNSGDVPPTVLEKRGDSVTLSPDEPGAYVYVDRLNPARPSYRLTVRAR